MGLHIFFKFKTGEDSAAGDYLEETSLTVHNGSQKDKVHSA